MHCFCFLPGPETIQIFSASGGTVAATAETLWTLYSPTTDGSLVHQMFSEIGLVEDIEVFKVWAKGKPPTFTAQVSFAALSADKLEQLEKGNYCHRSAHRITVTTPSVCQVKLGG